MSSSSRAWVVAASIGAVEALKDQGICRWNYVVRSGVQHAKNHVRAWIVAASIRAVEALKDQGICRWNHTVRSAVQHANTHLRSASQAKSLSSQSSAAISKGLSREDKFRQSEESFREVMYLSCWGPS
ncbi:hypothetical protein V6N13_018890 [Hibiscus sabdariffa]